MEQTSMDPPPQPKGVYWTLWAVVSGRGLLAGLRFIWILSNNFYCIPSYFFVMTILTPILLVSPKLYWQIEQIYFDWLLSMVACWTSTAGYIIKESGVRLNSLQGQRFLFMPNHQSTADVPLCMTIFTARRNFCKDVMWIMDKVFKYTNFGSVSWMHDDFFILAGKKNRESSLIKLKKHIEEVFIPKDRRYIVLFPEGGFLRNRKQVSQSFAKKSDLPNLQYVTLPRTGALEVIMEVLGPKKQSESEKSSTIMNGTLNDAKNNNININNTIFQNSSSEQSRNFPDNELQKIVDVTIAYPNGRPLDLLQIIFGWRKPCTTHVHYRVFDISEVPTEVEGMRQFMYQLYIDKEKMLAEYYSTGVFPYKMFDETDFDEKINGNNDNNYRHNLNQSRPPRELVFDNLRFFLLHGFFLVTSCLCWTLFWQLKSIVF